MLPACSSSEPQSEPSPIAAISVVFCVTTTVQVHAHMKHGEEDSSDEETAPTPSASPAAAMSEYDACCWDLARVVRAYDVRLQTSGSA